METATERRPVGETPESATWDIGGKNVVVSITRRSAAVVEFLGVAGKDSAGDVRGAAFLSASCIDGAEDTASISEEPTGNGLVDTAAFKQAMATFLEERGYVVN